MFCSDLFRKVKNELYFNAHGPFALFVVSISTYMPNAANNLFFCIINPLITKLYMKTALNHTGKLQRWNNVPSTHNLFVTDCTDGRPISGEKDIVGKIVMATL